MFQFRRCPSQGLCIRQEISSAREENPNIETRNSKQFSKYKFSNGQNFFEFWNFENSNLFRISCFGFRISLSCGQGITPFGNYRVKASSAAHRYLSQPATS